MKRNCLHCAALIVLVLMLAACSAPAQPQPAPVPTSPPPTAVPPAPTSPPPTAVRDTPATAPTATVAAVPSSTPTIAISPTITEMVKLGDITMYYAAYSKGEPLLLLHGGAASSDEVAKQVPAFAEKYRVITPDCRGQGRTTDSDAPLGYHLMAEDMVRLLDYLKIDKPYVVGWSDGGIIGIDLAIHHPERVRALVTYGANTNPDGITASFSDFLRNATTERLQKELGADYLRLSSTPEHLPVLVEKLRTLWLTEPNFTAEQLASIKAPTAIVDGEWEELIPIKHVEEIAKAIPNAQLIWIPRANHGALWTEPDEFNKIVLDFLKDK